MPHQTVQYPLDPFSKSKVKYYNRPWREQPVEF